MASIFDLMPASWWPVQPFIPPFDPTQPTMWPSGASGWTPPPSSPPPGWPAISANARSEADSSVSDWDRAMRQALAAQRDATSDPGASGIVSYDQMLADAKRAHDFVRWVLGPPSASQARPVGDATLRDGLPSVAGVQRNATATSAAAPPSVVAAAGADGANVLRPGLADQQPDLGAAYGNSKIARQGVRARTIAARPPPTAAADFFLSVPRGVVRGLANTASAGGQAAQIEMQQPVDVPFGDEATGIVEDNITGPLPKPQGVSGQFGETLGEFLGNPMSYLFPGSFLTKLSATAAAALASEAGGQITKDTWAEPYARFGGALLGGGLAGAAMARGPAAAEAAANTARRLPAAPGGVSRAPAAPAARSEIAGLPHAEPATVQLVPADPPDWDSALAAARLRGDIDLNALSARAHQVHGTLGTKEQGLRTTAVLSTDRSMIIGGGKKDLYPIQKPLRDGEIEAKMPGAHAEETVLREALKLNHRPVALATTRDICPDCEDFIKFMGGIISPDRRFAIFPP